MVHIHHEGIADAPVARTFEYVDDYRNTTEWMFGLSKFEPNTARLNGLDATFDGTFAVKPIKLHSSIRITSWAQDSVIGFESYQGFRIKSEWNFVALAAERSTVVVDFYYELPGGLAGRAMGRAMEPIVALSIRHSDDALRKAVAASYRRQQGI
jgi:uncharacterized membrane protein